ncbi:hypothetical protein DJ019_02330 [Phenylobacterium kunshanense]|uniref:Uncharacterized protein n=1 Tax=Phenylobacterium kunshanense TaxID=1445034 RepID=A0A328BNA8_9CAUL|nr:hypothetical protein DJ019_02330 [Phenylobacterium kunshanense]
MDARPPAFGVIRIASASRQPWLVFRTELGADPDDAVMHDVARFDDIGEARALARTLQQYADANRRPIGR